MKTKPTLELRDVENGLKAGLAKAAEKGWAVTVSVVDDGGHLLGLKRMDGCAAVAAYISPEKARTAALGQRGSGGYEKMINDGRTAFLCVDVLKGTLEGGLPIVIDGQVAGAVGVSGVKPNEDLEVAQAADLEDTRTDQGLQSLNLFETMAPALQGFPPVSHFHF